MEQITELVAKIEQSAPAGIREDVRQLVSEVLAFHREGLTRLVAAIEPDRVAEAARDPLVASLFELHDISALAPAPLLAPERLVRRAPRKAHGATCELCAAPAPGRHAHLVDIATRALVCACGPCASGFAYGGKLARVPDDVRLAADLGASDGWWALLGVPTGIAFFVPHGDHAPSVHYPGPAGVTDATVPREAWEAAVSAHASLAAIEPHVQALLVDRVDGAREHWIVGLDRCFELVARIREGWTGFTGGEGARDARKRFFAELAGDAR